MLAIILNILVFLCLGICIFLSYKRGVKKSLIHFGITICCLIITIFISSPITRAILNTQINVSGEIITLDSYLCSLFVNDASSFLSPLFSSVASAVIGPIVFLALFLLFYLVFEVAYILIDKFYLTKKPVLQEAKETKKYGIIVGVVECLMLTLLVFMPLTSLTTTVQELTTTSTETNESGTVSNVLKENLPSAVTDFVEFYNGSPLGVLTNWGAFNEPIANTISPVYIGETKLSLKQDIVPIVQDYDLIVDTVNDEKVDYTSLKNIAKDIIDSNVFDAVEKEIYNITENKEKFVDSLNLDSTLKSKVLEILTNFETRFNEEDFDLKSYVKENVEIALNEFENGIDIQNLKQFFEYADANNLIAIFQDELINSLCDVLESIGKLPILKEFFPLVQFSFDLLPSFVTDVIDVFYLDTYEDVVAVIPYAVNVISDLNSVKFSDTNQTLLQVFISNDTTFLQKFINSKVASDVLYNMASCESLRNFVISTFEKVDEKVFELLTSYGDTFNNRQLSGTISFGDTDERLNEFMGDVVNQTEDIVEIARKFLNDEVDLSDGKFLDYLKENIKKFYNFENGESESVFNNIFDNIKNYFNGTILNEDGTPVFAQWQEFKAQLEAQFDLVPEEEKIYGENSIYLTVSYEEIFKIIKLFK